MNRALVWVQMRDTSSGRGYGEGKIKINSLSQNNSYQSRIRLKNIYGLWDYVNVRLSFKPQGAEEPSANEASTETAGGAAGNATEEP